MTQDAAQYEYEIACLNETIEQHRGKVYESLMRLQEVLRDLCADKIRAIARQLVTKQYEHTLNLKVEDLSRLKQELETAIDRLPTVLEEAFDPVTFVRTETVTSGQVRQYVEKSCEERLRRVIAGPGKLFRSAGYHPEGAWAAKLAGEETPYGVRFPQPVELSTPASKVLDDLIDELTEIKIIEAKINYYQECIRRARAEAAWDAA